MILEPNQKLLVIGDSVTDADRSRPVGEGLFEAIGKGYVSLVDASLQVNHPAHRIRVVNMGCSGNNVRDLKARWDSDVLALKPDWVAVMIGINDCWRFFDCPNQTEWGVPLAEYRATLQSLVAATRPLVRGMILMTPYFLEPNRADPMRVMMDSLGQAVREIAATNDCRLVDTQAAFDRLMEQLHPMSIAWDRIHPNKIGQTLLAQSLLAALEA